MGMRLKKVSSFPLRVFRVFLLLLKCYQFQARPAHCTEPLWFESTCKCGLDIHELIPVENWLFYTCPLCLVSHLILCRYVPRSRINNQDFLDIVLAYATKFSLCQTQHMLGLVYSGIDLWLWIKECSLQSWHLCAIANHYGMGRTRSAERETRYS